MKSTPLIVFLLALASSILLGPLFLAPAEQINASVGKKCYSLAGHIWIVDSSSQNCTKIYFSGDLDIASVFPGTGSRLMITVQEGRDPLFHTFGLDFGPLKPDGIEWIGRNPENLFAMAEEVGWKRPEEEQIVKAQK